MKKWVEFGWKGDLVHRFIHPNWGESFVNIFLDLSVDISQCSSSTCACALQTTIEEHLQKATGLG
jgi:hypothetical protein